MSRNVRRLPAVEAPPWPLPVRLLGTRKRLVEPAFLPDLEKPLVPIAFRDSPGLLWTGRRPIGYLAEAADRAEVVALARQAVQSRVRTAILAPDGVTAAEARALSSSHHVRFVTREGLSDAQFLWGAGRATEALVRLGAYRWLAHRARKEADLIREELETRGVHPDRPTRESRAPLAVTRWAAAQAIAGRGFPRSGTPHDYLAVAPVTERKARRKTPPAFELALRRWHPAQASCDLTAETARLVDELETTELLAHLLEDELRAQEVPGIGELRVGLDRIEMRAIERALGACDGNVGKAAKRLGVGKDAVRPYARRRV